jgi:hypothetical protein
MNIFKRIALIFLLLSLSAPLSVSALAKEEKRIKWVEFGVTKEALADAAAVDIKTYGQERHYSWIELLSCLATQYGGDFSRYKKSDLEKVLEMWSRVKGDNLNTGIVLLIFAVFGALFVSLVITKVKKYKHNHRRRSKKRMVSK